MSIPQHILREVRTLILTIDAGESTETDQRRFTKLLAKYPEAMAETARLLDQQAALADAGRSKAKTKFPLALYASTAVSKHLNQSPSQREKPTFWRLMPAIAACLLLTHLAAVGLTWIALSSTDGDPDQSMASNANAPDYVQDSTNGELISAAPRLVAMTGCVWDDGETGQLQLGKKLGEGEVLNLLEGIVALEFGQAENEAQAKVRVEGPARLFIRRDGLLELNSGKLTADVHWHGGAFTIATAEGTIAISDAASIGVVATSERSEVHVFHGGVELSALWMQGNEPIVQLAEGEAVALLGDRLGEPATVHFEASASSFAWSQSMAFDRLDFGHAYRDAILESKPDVYWRFEDGDDAVENEGRLEGFTGYVSGSVSWYNTLENRALEFGLTETPGLLVSRATWPTEDLDNYTVQFWVKPSHYHKGALLGLVGDTLPDGRCPHSLLLELSGLQEGFDQYVTPNALRFVHRSPASVLPEDGAHCSSESPYSVRQWQQVVARKMGSRLELFCNAEKVASAENSKPLPVGNRVLIGQVYPVFIKASRGIAHRPFVGQIDEVSLYGRALSDKEIRRHYELGRQSPPDGDSM
ncbi:LamG domain-containing protein [Aeoliella sp. ICT_H6.2]|uniref:LamG domain-containing protein n=1 Tax=Aeoliella straminimaris TaxID=2954799 RepID=A0A9X2FDH3_9BACT|nr:LamG domain-containing protein [Aeoliella straminimaris]MCO6046950.1 LamG domain-containing protein [Aeoliella straminimaris]